MTLGNIIGTAFVIVIIISFVAFAITHIKWLLKLALGLFLVYLVLGIICDPSGLETLGWFVFSAICLALGVFLLRLIRNL